MIQCSHLWNSKPTVIGQLRGHLLCDWLRGGLKVKDYGQEQKDGGTASQRSSYLPVSLLPVFQLHTQLTTSCSSLCHISDFLSSRTARTMMHLGCEENSTHPHNHSTWITYLYFYITKYFSSPSRLRYKNNYEYFL